MTITTPAATGAPAERPSNLVTVTIDGVQVQVPKGTLVIRAAELIGVQIPRFCDHPLLDPVGACRQCLVEVEGQRKPLTSCTTTVTDGMVVSTQHTSPVADKAQKGVLELLLINHPLDCPVCDKGGECPLQNQAMSNGYAESRFEGVKRTFEKPIHISSQVLLDRERCVLCARCTRFSNQIAGDPFIEMLERGALQQVGIYEDQPFESYFSGNTIQICPVGALTSAAYRFRARPFDLVSVPTACEHCASGCSLRADFRRGEVVRRLAGDDPQVNEEWNCDKGRFAFRSATGQDRLTHPMVRDADGVLQPASWPEALAAAADGLVAARGRTGVLVGGRLTLEDAYAYSKFARVALKTNDIDFRARATSDEELAFLGSHVAGSGLGVTYTELENAPAVLLAGFEPEEESPIVFLRLHKAVRKGTLKVITTAPFTTRGSSKLEATVLHAAPGAEAQVLREAGANDEIGRLLRSSGAVILVGERLAMSPGAFAAAAELAASTGARLAWIPRRAGERGAVDAGAAPTLLPGGRPVADGTARAQVAAAWGVSSVPETAGRGLHQILLAAEITDEVDENGDPVAGYAERLDALVVAGVEIDDLPDPALARAALAGSEFIVSLEVRASEVTEHAHVVLPVPPIAERAGTFIDWEGRPRSFDAVLDTPTMSEIRVLAALADELDLDVDVPISLGFSTAAQARAEFESLGTWAGERPNASAASEPVPATDASPGSAVLATWRHLLDLGVGQDREDALAGTAPAPVVRLSAATAAGIGAIDGDHVSVSSDLGMLTLPLVVSDLPDGVVWVPTNSSGSRTLVMLGATSGSIVTLAKTSGGAA